MPPPTLTEQVKRLEILAWAKQKEADAEEQAATVARRREQVLADICRHAEEIMLLRARHTAHTGNGTAASQQQQGQPGPVRGTPNTPVGSPPSQQQPPSDHHSTRQHLQEQQRQQQPPQPGSQQPLLHTAAPHLAAVLQCVPHYCCSSCLLQSASADTIDAALSLSAQDWSQLGVALVYELSLRLDLIQRREDLTAHERQQQVPQLQAKAQNQQARQQGAAGGQREGGGSAGSDSSSGSHHQQQQTQQQQLQGTSAAPLSATSSGKVSGGSSGATGNREGTGVGGDADRPPATTPAGPSSRTPTCQGCGQLLSQQRPDSAENAAASEEDEEACGGAGGADDVLAVQLLAEQFLGLGFLAGAVSPAQVAEAVSLNHKTQRPQQAPDSHWQAVVQQLKLSAEQARHLGDCYEEVQKRIRPESAALQRLSCLANDHSLLVAAAEGQQQGDPQQPRLETIQQQEWRLLLRDMQQLNPSQAQAEALGPSPTHHHPASHGDNRQHQAHQEQAKQQQVQSSLSDLELVGKADAASAVVDAMDSHISQLALWCFLLSYMVYDCLTPLQRARMIVASYPWFLQPAPIALAAGQLYPMLQQQENKESELSTTQQQRLQQLQQQQEHQQQHRQIWWRSRLTELQLTSEEAQHVAMAGGCEPGAAAAHTASAAAGPLMATT